MLRDLNDGKMPDLKFGKVGGSDAPGTGGKVRHGVLRVVGYAEEKAAFVKALQRDY
jgi:hypothetical protein